MTSRIDQLRAKLDSRMVGRGALPGYGRNVDAIRAEIARLEGSTANDPPIVEVSAKEAEAALAKRKQETDETT